MGYFDTESIISYYESTKFDYQLYNTSKRNIALHFGFWNKNTRTPKQALLNEHLFLQKFSNITKEDNVIDIGCGYGATAIWLAKNIGCKVTGITLGTKQIAAANKLAQLEGVEQLTKFFEMDFHRMSFPDKTFSKAIAIESICHSNNKSQALKECSRVIKQGGSFTIGDSFLKKENFSSNEKLIMTSYLSGLHIPDLKKISEFENLLKQEGYNNIVWEDKTHYILPALKTLQKTTKFLIPISKFARLFNIPIFNLKHISAFNNQYYALANNLTAYGFLRGLK